MAEPAVDELKSALARIFPEIFPGQDPFSTKPMPRLQAAPGDHNSNPNYDSSTDPHAAGLALDIVLLVWVAQEKKLAENLVDLFVYYKGSMGWSAVIYNHVTTDDFGGPRPYGGSNDHTTHIHIEWGKSRASTTGFIGGMEDDLNDLHDRWVNNQPLPNETTEDEMAWLHGWWTVWDGNTYYYHFDPNGLVRYTKTKPAATAPPPPYPLNTGRYSYSSNGQMELNWDGGTQEVFQNAFPNAKTMNATSNRYSPLVATRIS